MQTVTQTVNDLSYVLGLPRSRVNSIARALIDGGVLPKSSGRAIEKVNAEQLSGFVAAAAMADKVEEAAAVARRFMDMPFEGKDDAYTFKAAFAEQMAAADRTAAPQITFGKTAGGLTVTLEGRFIYLGDLSEGALPFYENTSWGGWTRTSITIASEGVAILRNLFNRSYDADGRPVYRSATI